MHVYTNELNRLLSSANRAVVGGEARNDLVWVDGKQIDTAGTLNLIFKGDFTTPVK